MGVLTGASLSSGVEASEDGTDSVVGDSKASAVVLSELAGFSFLLKTSKTLGCTMRHD